MLRSIERTFHVLAEASFSYQLEFHLNAKQEDRDVNKKYLNSIVVASLLSKQDILDILEL